MSIIANLKVMLGADSSELTSQFKKTDKQGRAWAKAQERRNKASAATFRAVGAAAATIGVALATATLAAIKSADQLGKTAAKLGVSVETLGAYRFAAERAGITTRNLDTSIQRFTRRMAEAGRGTGVLKDAFGELGIELRNNDGSLRSNEEVLRDYADAIKNAESPSERLRLAFQAFDTEGAQMVTMLGNGSAGLDEFMKKAVDAGVVMETSVTKKAGVMNDRLGTFSDQVMTGVNTGLINMAWGVSNAFDDLVGATSLAFGVKMPEYFTKFRIVMVKSVTKGFAEAAIAGVKGMQSMINGFVNLRDYAPAWVSALLGWTEGSADSTVGNSFVKRLEKDVNDADAEILKLQEKLKTYKAMEELMISSKNKSDTDKAKSLADMNSVGVGADAGATSSTEAMALEARNKLLEKQAKWETTVKNSRQSNLQSGIDLLGKFAKEGSAVAKMTIVLQTALNIANIVMSTEAAKMRALAELGPVAGLPMAASIQAMGAVSMGIAGAAGAVALAGQFHDGIDNVPSTGTYLLEKGERVVDSRLNGDLKDALSSGGGMGQSGTQNITFSVQGVEDPDVINKVIQQNRGDFESMLRQINADRAGGGLI
tara:strand:- start:4092 stop:5888 length:1797 start_codon:yes stop_codon:yes gene_type:complete